MITVMKFGGTSVGSAEAFRRSAEIIRAGEGSKVVVVSAMSGVTNYLIGFLDSRDKDADEVIETLRAKHSEVAREIMSPQLQNEYMEILNSRLTDLKRLLEDPSQREDPNFYDIISSQGERLSALTMAFVLREMGVDAVPLSSEEAGIHAVGSPGAGFADLDLTSRDLSYTLRPLLENGKVPVITGFYGRNGDGKPMTFGRGGSDYSAAVIAHAIDADSLEIWTDVDGFMTADPRIVPEARTISEMNFSEAAELAYFGAKVLHPRTIEPVRRKHIPVKVKNTFNPEGSGTIIHHLRAPQDELLRSVALKTDLSIITVYSSEIAYKPKMVARIIDRIGDANVIVYAISTSLSTVAFLVHNLDVKVVLRNLNTLESDDIERIDVKSNMCLICAVGDNLLDRCGASAEIFSKVRDAGANVELISEGASTVSLNFVVPMDHATAVVKALHDGFIGDKS
ncbi:MAG: aspartate kinase [Candidatus Methanomethylophilaceae archaeon]|nr:aspartate kinase [Candidatus Methanomethylophilaceae archaeon]